MGLMGLDLDGTLYLPNGKRFAKLSFWLSDKIQRAQHALAPYTWR